MASQTQKHVTFNELVNKVDNILMLSVISTSQQSPPNSPLEGQRYIIPNGALGDWSGKSGNIAFFYNQAWDYLAPTNGFIAHSQEDGQIYYFNNIWKKLSFGVSDELSIGKIGIGTNADNSSPFSTKLNQAIFCAKYNTETGDGNVRIKINKENSSNTGSIIFQDNWYGRAEIGLCGDNNFSIKTSINGTNWMTPFAINSQNGELIASSPLVISQQNQTFQTILKHSDGARVFTTSKTNDDGGTNLFIGRLSGNPLLDGTTNLNANGNVSLGNSTLSKVTSGSSNVAFGTYSLSNNLTGSENVAIGHASMLNNINGGQNTAIGAYSLWFKTDGSNFTSLSNCSGIGANTRVSGSNQVQLGDTTTTTYAYGAIQNRSDIRDKTDIRDTKLGLDFILKLRPVDFRWDMRDDYLTIYNQKDVDGNVTTKLIRNKKDGSKKRKRYHHGLIAQEIKKVAEIMNIDFGGLQDHSKNGGADVFSVGYEEFIAPMIKAIQELNSEIEILKNQNNFEAPKLDLI